MKIDPAELRGRDRYRLLISAVVPRPIAFVTSQSPSGIVNLAPFSFFQGVSVSPPTVSIAVGRKRDGSPKDTWRNIQETGEYVIHAVTGDLLDAVIIAAAEWPAEESEVQRADLTTTPSEAVAVPRLQGTALALECRRHSIQEVHGVGLIVGEVLRFHVDEALLTDPDGPPEIDFTRLRPLARLGGDGYVQGGDIQRRERLRVEDLT